MCRLAYITKPFPGMQEWLTGLEISAGSHGSGVAIGKQLMKGFKKTARHTGAEVVRHNFLATRGKKKRLPALWHTRRTSSGGHHDDLCHPFACDGGWLAHNGHWHDMAVEAAKVRGRPMSDTRMFSIIVNEATFTSACKDFRPPGVWLHMLKTGELAVHKRGGDLVYCPETGCFGSEPARFGEWHEVADGYTAHGDTPELVQPVDYEVNDEDGWDYRSERDEYTQRNLYSRAPELILKERR